MRRVRHSTMMHSGVIDFLWSQGGVVGCGGIITGRSVEAARGRGGKGTGSVIRFLFF